MNEEKQIIYKPVRNTGFVYEPEAPKDFIEKSAFNPDAPLGRISTAPELPIIFPDGHGWHGESVRAKAEMQFNPKFDSFSCVTFSIARALVAYANKVYGVKFSVAEMYNAFHAGTVYGAGTSVKKGMESFRLKGWVKDELYPFTAKTTKEQYFSKPPIEIELKAKGKLIKWIVYWEQLDYSNGNVPHDKIIASLKRTPALCSGFAWAAFLGEGVYYDYNNQPNHLFPVDEWSDNPEYDLLAYDSYPQDNQYDENSPDEEFVKKLAKTYRVWSAHRIWLTPLKKKLTYKSMLEKIVMMIPGGAKFLVKISKDGSLKKQEITNWNSALAALIDEVGCKTMSPADMAKIPDTKEFFPFV